MDLESSKRQLLALKIPSCMCAHAHLGLVRVPGSKHLCCSEGRCPSQGFSGCGLGLGVGEGGTQLRKESFRATASLLQPDSADCQV